MIIGFKDKEIVANILKNYMKSNQITAYKLNKLKIISNKTFRKLMDINNKKISFNTVEKLYNKLNFESKDKKIIGNILAQYKNIIKKEDINKIQEVNIETLLKENSDKIINNLTEIIEKKLIQVKPNNSQTVYEKEDYMSKRKINSFYSDFDTRTLLITKIWELNDTIFDKWKEVDLLLGIGNAKDVKKIKKGLSTVAKNLKDIAEQLENAGANSKSVDDEVIIIKGE